MGAASEILISSSTIELQETSRKKLKPTQKTTIILAFLPVLYEAKLNQKLVKIFRYFLHTDYIYFFYSLYVV